MKLRQTTHDCVGALLVRDGQVLLGRRAEQRDWLPGAWDVVGGHIEAGESPEAAITRELAEELGVVPARLRELGVLDSEAGGWRLRLYVVVAWSGEPVNRCPDEHAELRWMPPAEAARRLAAAHAGFAALIAAAVA